jgi:hypothetical protein
VTITSNLDVPAGASCNLNWVEVVGNVAVTVQVSLVNGYSSRPIAGNLTIANSSGQSGIYPANHGNNVVKGNITVTELHDGGSFTISQATVNGTVNLNDNAGRTDIAYLSIGKPLNCSGNEPAPTSWSQDHGYGSSITAPQKTGQCSGF